MVYQNKVVAVIKVDGKVLREDNGSVRLPFGSEYSVLVKNLNSVRVEAKITIDGKDVGDGRKRIEALYEFGFIFFVF